MSEQKLDSSGQNWQIKSESAEDIIDGLSSFLPTIFDEAEIKTLGALVREHNDFEARLTAAEQTIAELREVVDEYAEPGHWVCPDCISHTPHQVHPQIFWIKTTNGYDKAKGIKEGG